MDLDQLLGIDASNPVTRRARHQSEADDRLIADLVQRRKDLGLSQADVAERMDISQGALSRIESGVRDPHVSTLRRYAVAVEATIEHFVVADDIGRARASRMARAFAQSAPTKSPSVWRNPAVSTKSPWNEIIRSTHRDRVSGA